MGVPSALWRPLVSSLLLASVCHGDDGNGYLFDAEEDRPTSQNSIPDAVNCGSNGALCDDTSGYIVILDAGSTGSRSYVFRYQSRLLQTHQFPLIVDPPLTIPSLIASFNTHPGISSFHKNTDGIAGNLGPILQSAAHALRLFDPFAELRHVPVYMGATAGMRGLHRGARDKVMHAVRTFLRSDGNPFSFAREEQARVLSGEEEGAFAWLSLNQQEAVIDPSPNTTFGSLDFGGGSIQIAFVPEDVSILSSFFPMHFGGSVKGPIHLYTHSFPRFGFVDAFQRFTGLLQEQSRNKGKGKQNVLDHPCLPVGLTWKVDDGEFGVTTTAEKPQRKHGDLELHGVGNFESCYELAKRLIDKDVECLLPPCSMLGVNQPSLGRSRFVLLSAHEQLLAWEVLTLMEKGEPMLKALRTQLAKVCGLEIATQVELFGDKGLSGKGGVPPCWEGTWIFTVLKDGLGFPEDHEPQQIRDVPDCCEHPLGQAIYEVNFFPYRVSRQSYRSLYEALRMHFNGPINGPALALGFAVSALVGAFAAVVLLKLWPTVASLSPRSKIGQLEPLLPA